jgi:type III secretion protein Q
MRTDEATIVERPKTPSVRRIKKLSRAHVELSARPRLTAQLRNTVEKVSTSLSQFVGARTRIEARLLDSPTLVEGRASQMSAMALFDLAGCEGAIGLLEIELPFLVHLLNRIGGREDEVGPVGTLTHIEHTAFGYLCLWALSSLTKETRFIEDAWSPRLIAVHPGPAPKVSPRQAKERCLAIALSFSCGSAEGRGRLFVSAAAVEAALMASPPESDEGVSFDKVLAMRCRPRLGRMLVAKSTLKNLSPGDVVVFDSLGLFATGIHGPARLTLGAFTLVGDFGANGFVVADINQEPNMNHENEPSGYLPVEIEVELTRLRVPIRELSAYKAGTIIPLRVSPTEPVLLRIDDEPLARAELVEVDGSLGARVIEVLK